jgi:hypothetical protein
MCHDTILNVLYGVYHWIFFVIHLDAMGIISASHMKKLRPREVARHAHSQVAGSSRAGCYGLV